MSATDELRRLLDERGAEWWPDDDFADTTHWKTRHIAATAGEGKDGMLYVQSIVALTPAQAVEATLGTGTCQMEYANEVPYAVLNSLGTFFCSECGSPTYNDMTPTYCPYCGAKVVDT